MRIHVILSGLLLATSFLGCATTGGVGKSDKLYKSFYLEDGGLKYFIKPMKFKGSDSELLIDFNIESFEGDSAVVNFSIFHSEPFKKLSSFRISTPDTAIKAYAIKSMFVELEKSNNYESRFTSLIPNTGLKKIFTEPNWEINARRNQTELTFHSRRKIEKDINLIDRAVFQLLD